MAQDRAPDLELAETFAEVARTLQGEGDVDATLARTCEMAVTTIEGCETAGISIAERGRITSPSATSHLPRDLDDIQSQTQQGPCIDAIKEHEVFLTGALSKEERWPDFAARARDETGVESILSVRLFARQDTLGSLNLYSSQRDAFDDHDVAVASVLPPMPPSPCRPLDAKASSRPSPPPATSSARPRASSWPASTCPMTRPSTSCGGRHSA